MPGYPWLGKTMLDPNEITPKLRAMKTLGVPYTDEQIAKGADEVRGKTEQDALIAYLQVLGTALRNKY